jgi:hypothetical protein
VFRHGLRAGRAETTPIKNKPSNEERKKYEPFKVANTPLSITVNSTLFVVSAESTTR